ncbi:hypothetical protein INR49_008780 [Caranx melampygus]|nr:hypothetical protein INR49_008780 [Caranx melampygus]
MSQLSDLVESSDVHRLDVVLEGCDLLLQDVCAHLCTADLQLLDAVTHWNQFGCRKHIEHVNSFAMSVSSSHGLTSNRIEDFAMRAGSGKEEDGFGYHGNHLTATLTELGQRLSSVN